MNLRLLACALLTSIPASAQTAVDGDTIKLNGQNVRLWGIDAPEARQMCGHYGAGLVATGTLQQLMNGKVVVCETRDIDRYGRPVALCRADGRDLGADMVRSGAAWAFVRYSRDYVELEEQARREQIGVHAFDCELPWDWRARQRR